jgi:hypothetical protein
MNESHEFEKECDDRWRKNAEDVVGQNRFFFIDAKIFYFNLHDE